jgi:photosystem II stability/assembly factor-like uncharacterized protein
MPSSHVRGALYLILIVLAASAVPPLAAANVSVPSTMLDALSWRLVGPFRGGWSTMAVGVPDEPDTYYFGAAGGGVWMTHDSGQTWAAISDSQPIAAIGAIALAPSNPKVIYVGTGHPEPRYDIAAGDGLYKSRDGGQSWQHVGLAQTRYIGSILVDPRDPDVVLVAALGHLFGPNAERGVFRSSDGGRSWNKTLFVNDDTGAVDLAADPANADVVYAATWQARDWPWLSYFTPMVGAGSGLYKSSNGGRTWAVVAGKGWPHGKLGRIGLAVTHFAHHTRIYASVTAEDVGGLYRSDDDGANWKKVNDAKAVTTWYMSRLTVSPTDPDTLYTVGQSIHKSTDGGASFSIIRGAPGGDDYHYLWINPKHPERMITASDQGAVVSVNGGATWSSWFNQPTGQFYHVATDNRFPYWIYSGQQDSGTVAIASRSDYGSLSFRDWHPVGGDERDYDIPDPADENIVYGSGLGGRISRWDQRTGEVQNVTPWPVNSYGKRPTDYKYHYTWFTPIALARHAPWSLYAGSQLLWRTTDQGQSWQIISPDLSARARGARSCDGDPTLMRARDCGFGVIYSIAPSPRSNDEIWIGTDDGQIQLTRDSGKTWRNITPKALSAWAKVSVIEPSARADGVAYAAVDNHRLDDYRPHILRTRDYGATWTEITAGLPSDHYVSVVRADPLEAALLYAGTDIGAFVSFDDGDAWQPLQLNLPPAWVHDLQVHGDDLIAATQGRAIWILDDISLLRQAGSVSAEERAHLFKPAPAVRLRADQNKDTPLPPETPLGSNPPSGAVIDYWLAANSPSPVSIEVHDSKGMLVRRFASTDKIETLPVKRYFDEQWLKPTVSLSDAAGAHRFVWDLRYPRPRAIEYNYGINASRGVGTPVVPQGPLTTPGEYKVSLTVDGRSYEQPLVVIADPRVVADLSQIQSTLEFSGALATALERVWRGHAEVSAIRKALEVLQNSADASAATRSVRRMAMDFSAKTKTLVEGDGETKLNLSAISATLADIATDVEGTDRAPTAAQRAVFKETQRHTDQALAYWKALRGQDLAKLNANLRRVGLIQIVVPPADQLRYDVSAESSDLP